MLVSILVVLVSLTILSVSADRLINAASLLGPRLGIPSLVVGMFAVGFGTSAPELAVSVSAAVAGRGDMALGNALGSNILNLGVLGLTLAIAPMRFEVRSVFPQLLSLLLVSTVAGVAFYDGGLSRWESLGLLFFFAMSLYYTISTSKGQLETTEEAGGPHVARHVFAILVYLIVIILSSKALLWGTENIAREFGVSDLVIGLTVTAFGTSIPEIIVSFMALRRGQLELALGNVIGSNLFNTAAVVGASGVVANTILVPAPIMTRDWPFVMLLSVSLFAMILLARKKSELRWFHGHALISICFLYYVFLWLGKT